MIHVLLNLVLLSLISVKAHNVLVLLLDFGDRGDFAYTIPFRPPETTEFFPKSLRSSNSFSDPLPDARINPIRRLDNFVNYISYGKVSLSAEYQRVSLENVRRDTSISIIKALPQEYLNTTHEYVFIVSPYNFLILEPFISVNERILFLNGYRFLRETDSASEIPSLQSAFCQFLGMQTSLMSSPSGTSFQFDPLELTTSQGDFSYSFPSPFNLLKVGWIVENDLHIIKSSGMYALSPLYSEMDKSVTFPYHQKWNTLFSQKRQNPIALFIPTGGTSSGMKEGFFVWRKVDITYTAGERLDLSTKLVVHRYFDGMLTLYHPYGTDVNFNHFLTNGFPTQGTAFQLDRCRLQLEGESDGQFIIRAECDAPYSSAITSSKLNVPPSSDFNERIFYWDRAAPSLLLNMSSGYSGGYLGIAVPNSDCATASETALPLLETPELDIWGFQYGKELRDWVFREMDDLDPIALCWASEPMGPFFEQSVPFFIREPFASTSVRPDACSAFESGGRCENGCSTCAIEDIACFDDNGGGSCFCFPENDVEGDVALKEMCCSSRGSVSGWSSEGQSFVCQCEEDWEGSFCAFKVNNTVSVALADTLTLFISVSIPRDQILDGEVQVQCFNASNVAFNHIFISASDTLTVDKDISHFQGIQLNCQVNSFASLVQNDSFTVHVPSALISAPSDLRVEKIDSRTFLQWENAGNENVQVLWRETDSIDETVPNDTFGYQVKNVKGSETSLDLEVGLTYSIYIAIKIDGVIIFSDRLLLTPWNSSQLRNTMVKEKCQFENRVCSDRGTCNSLSVCNCDRGFHGQFCQLTECFKSENEESCSGNGECLNDNGSAYCSCFEGFFGRFCHRKDWTLNHLEIFSQSEYPVENISTSYLFTASPNHNAIVHLKYSNETMDSNAFTFFKDEWTRLDDISVFPNGTGYFSITPESSKKLSIIVQDSFEFDHVGQLDSDVLKPFVPSDVQIEMEETPETIEKKSKDSILSNLLPYFISLGISILVVSVSALVIFFPRIIFFLRKNRKEEKVDLEASSDIESNISQ